MGDPTEDGMLTKTPWTTPPSMGGADEGTMDAAAKEILAMQADVSRVHKTSKIPAAARGSATAAAASSGSAEAQRIGNIARAAMQRAMQQQGRPIRLGFLIAL